MVSQEGGGGKRGTVMTVTQGYVFLGREEGARSLFPSKPSPSKEGRVKKGGGGVPPPELAKFRRGRRVRRRWSGGRADGRG